MRLENGPGSANRNRVQVIAEAGQCHEGDFKRALRMIDEAADGLASAIKFQLLQPHTIAAPSAPKYWRHGDDLDQRGVFLRNGLLPYRAHIDLADAAEQVGIQLIGTPFDVDAVDVLAEIGNPIKIASGDITNSLLLDAVADTGLPVILSTGAATLPEIHAARRRLTPCAEVILLACSLQYPTPPEHAALGRIRTLLFEFGGRVGYSDHTLDTWAAGPAVAMGATVLEKHFTVDGWSKPVPDHDMALVGVDELLLYKATAEMAAAAVQIDWLEPHPGEGPAAVGARRSWYATADLPAGAVLTVDNVAPLRPLHPDALDAAESVLGAVVGAAVAYGDPITPGMIR